MKCWKCGTKDMAKKFLIIDSYALYERYHWVCKDCFELEEDKVD